MLGLEELVQSLRFARKVQLIVIACLALTGCTAAITGFPDRSVDPTADLAAVEPYFSPKAITDYGSCTPKRDCRNNILEARIHADDVHFSIFEQQLYSQGIGFGIGTDWLALALNTVGSNYARAATALNASAGAVSGASAAYQKDALYNHTLPLVMAQMVAKRKEVLALIRAGENQDEATYPLFRGLNDLEDYYYAGSLPGALNNLATSTGAQSKAADEKLAALTLVIPVDAAVQVRREKIADFLKSKKASTANLKAFVNASGVTASSDPLKDSLDLLNASQTDAQLAAFCSRYAKVFTGESC
jgi:hypothetical protein